MASAPSPNGSHGCEGGGRLAPGNPGRQGYTAPSDAAVARVRLRRETLEVLHRAHRIAVALRGTEVAGALDSTARDAFGAALDILRREAIDRGLDINLIEAEPVARAANVPDEGEPVVGDCD